MLKNFEQTAALLEEKNEKKVFHIAGAGKLLRKLPRGHWIGGSTEYFMAESGGIVSADVLDVTEFAVADRRIASYGVEELPSIAADSYSDGFSLVIIPAFSEAHRRYAHSAAKYEGLFLKTIAGWVSGFRLERPEEKGIAVNGETGDTWDDRAVALHIRLPEGLRAELNIINIFSPDANSPAITFEEDAFTVKKCRIDGKEADFVKYLAENRLDTTLPLVGDYMGNGIAISLDRVMDDGMRLYAPVFRGIEYRFAKPVPDYAAAFRAKLAELGGTDPLFACNCIFNFLHGDLEGKKLGGGYGPVSFGEIAWQLMNQALMYLRLERVDSDGERA
ncbi:MAG: hypothetical protein LBG76_04780 [Treponema sp.]|jgi:hypothetical protein|nr:hypothetical protein [Treponema sp.]